MRLRPVTAEELTKPGALSVVLVPGRRVGGADVHGMEVVGLRAMKGP